MKLCILTVAPPKAFGAASEPGVPPGGRGVRISLLPLIRKEIRLLLPAWVAAMLLAIVPVWLVYREELAGLSDRGAAITFYCFVFGALVPALVSFGQEFTLGTFSTFIAQPFPRRRLWMAKTGLLAAGQVLALLALCVSFELRIHGTPHQAVVWEMIGLCGLFALSIFAGGLWTTLLFRQVAAALWFTLLVPAAIVVSLATLLNRYPDRVIAETVCTAVLLYSVAGFLLARRQFLRAQDTPWTGGTISLPGWLAFGATKPTAAATPSRGPLRALIRKEFQSHHISLLLGGLLLLLHLAAIALRKIQNDPAETNKILYEAVRFWWVLWFASPLVVGSAAVAEERKLGTLESQLCLPTTRRAQFTVKFVMALLLGILLGGLMPWLLEGIGSWAGVPGYFVGVKEPSSLQRLVVLCLISTGISVVSFYASTLGRGLVQALGLTFISGAVLTGFAVWALNEAFGSFDGSHIWLGPLVIYIGLPTLAVVLLWLAFRNFQRLLVGWNLWLRNLITVVASMAFIVTATALIYNRAWELLMTLEPKHGAARLADSALPPSHPAEAALAAPKSDGGGSPVRPRICVAGVYSIGRLPDGALAYGSRIFALLPDGRIWVAKNYEFRETGESVSVSKPKEHLEKIEMAVPVSGELLAASSWLSLASSRDQVVGIQSDGSLWKLFSAARTNIVENLSAGPQPERIGNDSDWNAVAAGYAHFLALKQDGTLWGWGNNEWGQLGISPNHLTNGLARIGKDQDWISIFASGPTSIGVKRDGSVWRWGWLALAQDSRHPEPMRWNLEGTNWLTVQGGWGPNLAVRGDGTLWVMGHLPARLLGQDLPAPDDRNRLSEYPIRVGSDSDWRDVTMRSGVLALKNSGVIVEGELSGFHLAFWGKEWKPSKYSDWTAIATYGWDSYVALAADGTLCSWGDPVQEAWERLNENPRGRPVLGPSRRPIWSVNIFAEAK